MLPTDGDYLLYVGDEKIPILASSGASRKSNLKGIRPICPHCGTNWAKLDLSPRNERNEYAVARWPCGECWNPYFTPGSLWKLLCWWDHRTDQRLEIAAKGFFPRFLLRETPDWMSQPGYSPWASSSGNALPEPHKSSAFLSLTCSNGKKLLIAKASIANILQQDEGCLIYYNGNLEAPDSVMESFSYIEKELL